MPDHLAVLAEVPEVVHHVLEVGLLDLEACSIQGEAVLLEDLREVHRDDQVGRVEVPGRAVRVDHREIAFLVVYADQDLVQVVLVAVDRQVHWVLWEVQVGHWDADHSMVLVDNQAVGPD